LCFNGSYTPILPRAESSSEDGGQRVKSWPRRRKENRIWRPVMNRRLRKGNADNGVTAAICGTVHLQYWPIGEPTS
jgi:hypothetical protein